MSLKCFKCFVNLFCLFITKIKSYKLNRLVVFVRDNSCKLDVLFITLSSSHLQ